MQLVRYEQAKTALSEAVAVDEVKDVRDKSIAVAAYAKQADDRELEINARELRLRAERRLGQLMAEMPKAKGAKSQLVGPGVIGGGDAPPPIDTPTLDEVGINKDLAKAARKAASLPDDDFESALAEHRERGEVITLAKLTKKPHVASNSGNPEWYTPPEYIEAARQAMGSIDVDPASSDVAQQNVRAATYYTENDDGLLFDWPGNVWLNPPYKSDAVGLFVSAVVQSVRDGVTKQACVLVNNATETGWAQELLAASAAVCFPRGRIKFLNADLEVANSPLQGQVIAYLGRNPAAFVESFGEFGRCIGECKPAAKPKRIRKSGYSDDFERFWDVYSRVRRDKKKDAYGKWKSLVVGQDIDPEYVIEAAAEYAASPQGKSEFCAGPLPWLTKQRWEDDRESWQNGGKQSASDITQATLREYGVI